MESAPGNVTIAALLATGATTLGLSLAGIVGLSDRVRAGDEARQTPTVQEVRDRIDSDRAVPPSTPAPTTPAPARPKEL